jgi:hypothetical protein
MKEVKKKDNEKWNTKESVIIPMFDKSDSLMVVSYKYRMVAV